jgi:hypothetical protein
MEIAAKGTKDKIMAIYIYIYIYMVVRRIYT